MNQFPGVPAKLLCDRHLLGVHGESHKFLPTWKKKISASGWIKNNCMEPENYKARHDEVAEEMTARKMNHLSPIEQPDFSYLPDCEISHEVSPEFNRLKLMDKCWECRQRITNCRNTSKEEMRRCPGYPEKSTISES